MPESVNVPRKEVERIQKEMFKLLLRASGYMPEEGAQKANGKQVAAVLHEFVLSVVTSIALSGHAKDAVIEFAQGLMGQSDVAQNFRDAYDNRN